MAKRKPTKTQQLRKLVQQQVRRMESRGYRIDDAVKEKIKSGKYQTLQSLRRNRYEKLYSSASAEIDSKIVSGTKKRSYERKEVAKRAAETRRLNRYVKRRDWLEQRKETPEEIRERESYHDQLYYDEDYEQEWEDQHEEKWREQRSLQDERDRVIAEEYEQGELTYNEINRLIDKFPSQGSLALKKAMEKEIQKYGRNAVIEGLANAPDYAVNIVQNIVFYEDSKSGLHTAFIQLFDTIIGTIRTEEDAKMYGELLDEMTDFEAF